MYWPISISEIKIKCKSIIRHSNGGAPPGDPFPPPRGARGGLWRGTCPGAPMHSTRLPLFHQRVWGYLPFLHVPMHAMRLSVHCTLYSTVYLITLYYTLYSLWSLLTRTTMRMLMSWWRESFDWQNGHYKLTGQCDKHTISFAFKLL